MPRFYLAQPLSVGMLVDLPEAVAHHAHVLRLQTGTELTLFNGAGGEFIASLASVEKRRASAMVTSFNPREAELAYPLTLAQGLPEGSKMDWILEKAVELGVAAIQPLATQRCVVRLAGERADKKRAHWEGVVVSASEQSGRNRLTQVAPVAELAAWLTTPATGQRILLSPRAEQSLAKWASNRTPTPVSLLIGPEGGFTCKEEEMATKHGAITVSMGPRILRTETAGLAAVSVINGFWDIC